MGFFQIKRSMTSKPFEISRNIKTWMAAGLAAAALLSQPAQALPEGATVIHGGANIQRNGQNMTIQQTTQQAIINWNGFSISANELVQFLQPGAAASVLNRVTGLDASVINGILQGNGNIFLINPNGVLIGPGGMVNAGGFLASTLELSNSDFLSGNLRFKQGAGHDLAAVVNQGKIKVNDGGFVVLLAPSVANEGLILAKNGEVALGAGKEATLNFDGRDLIHFAVNDAPVGNGTVVMSQASANNVLAQVVNNLGIEEAGSLSLSGTVEAGDILLQGETANVASQTLSGQNLDMDFTGSVELNSQFMLDGGNIDIEAGGNITFDTLVAERLGNQGGTVSLRAGGSQGIVANVGGSGIAAELVQLEATNGSIATSIAADTVVANAPNGNIALSLRPGLINPQPSVSTGTTGGGTTTGIPTGGSGSTTTTGGTSTGSGSIEGTSGSSTSTGGREHSRPGIPGAFVTTGSGSGGSGNTGSDGVAGSTSTSGSSGMAGTGSGGLGQAWPNTLGQELVPGITDMGGGTGTDTDPGTAVTDPEVMADASGESRSTAVGVNGTKVTAHAGGDVAIDSVNTLIVEQVSGRNVALSSQTGSVIDSGDRVGVGIDHRDIIASGNVAISAHDYVGTIDNPLEVEIGGDLAVYAGQEVDGISGVLVGLVGGGFLQSPETAGVVLLNPGSGLGDGITQAQRGVMDNSLPGDDSVGGASVANLFLVRLVNVLDDEQWLNILRGTVLWEDTDDEATEL